ncbi:MAG: hypothetical protein NVS3B15_04280 [Sediminibacterium sp.]
MNYFKKILLLLLVACIALNSAEAQHRRGKRKVTAQKTRNNSGGKKKVAGSAKKSPDNRAASDASSRVLAREGLADTASPRVVTITSVFKPSLKTAAKVNFTAASPVIDSSRTQVAYNIPSQNLLFSYQPVPIKPLALPVDSAAAWENDHYIKVGVGNFSTGYLDAAFSFGDGKKSITNIRGNYITTKGNLPAQQYSKIDLDVLSIINTNNNNEWTTRASYENSTRYFYGYEPLGLAYPKDQLLQRFNTAGIEVGLQNKAPNTFNISYHPQVKLDYFSDNRQGKEFHAVVKAPLSKTFGKIYALDVGVTADIATTTFPFMPNTLNLPNNLYYVNTALKFNTPNFKLNAGIKPAWDNSVFSVLPDITAEARIGESNFIVEAGWTGYFNKNSYRSLTIFNPWTDHFRSLLNTKVREQYGGFKGSAGNHFTYNARVSFLQLNNQPLFVNNTYDGKSFDILYEPDMQVLKIHGEIGYTVQEKLSVLAGATFQRFNSLSVYNKAWGLLPFEATGTVKWKVWKDLQLRSDIFIWDGSYYRDKAGQSFKLDPAADLNAGMEFTVMPRLNLWLQLNNLLNNKYQRWNQYEVLGLNVLGGVVYSFR